MESAPQPFRRSSVVVQQAAQLLESGGLAPIPGTQEGELDPVPPPPPLPPSSERRRSVPVPTLHALPNIGEPVPVNNKDILDRLVPMDGPAPTHLQPITPEHTPRSHGASTTPPAKLSPPHTLSPVPPLHGGPHSLVPGTGPSNSRHDLLSDDTEAAQPACVGSLALVRRRRGTQEAPPSLDVSPVRAEDAGEDADADADGALRTAVLTPGKVRRRASAAALFDMNTVQPTQLQPISPG